MRVKNLGWQGTAGVIVIIVGVLVGAAGLIANTQLLRANEAIAAELVGGLAFSAEGAEVGEVSAVTVGEDNEIAEIRVTVPQLLGLGPKIVSIGRGRFMVLRGAVVLDLTAEEVIALPSSVVLRTRV